MADLADAFHLTGDEDSDYEDSFQASRVFLKDATPERSLRSIDVDEYTDEKQCDFLTMITAISEAYANGRYIKMRCLDGIESVQLGGGNDFEVSSSVLDLPVVCARDQRKIEISQNKVIMKKLGKDLTGLSMSRVKMATFVRELRVLNHLYGHDNIVRLRGVGWLYEFMDDEHLTPCPKPVLILEEAVGTLETIIDAFPALSLRSEMSICRDIASGLLAVHQCGLSHGDVKPANILMFQETIVNEGVEIAQFRAKISDFSLARISSNTSRWSPGGTLGYMAPECDRQLSVAQLMLADVWSLGITFARILLRRHNFNPRRHEAHSVDMEIAQLMTQEIQQSTWDPEIAVLKLCLLFRTVQRAPELRDLNVVFVALQNFLGPTFDEDNGRAPRSTLIPPAKAEIYIGYEHFKSVGAQVKDLIQRNLEKEANDPQSPRQASALFELAVISYSEYICPHKEAKEKATQYLHLSAQKGDVRARGLYTRFSQASRPIPLLIPDENPDPELRSWLEEAALRGHKIALEDLANLEDPTQFNIVNQTLSRSASHTHGDTPLISAARRGDCRAIITLLERGADPLLTNNLGENMLHFAWRFTEQQATHIILLLNTPEPILMQEAKGFTINDSMEFIPVPPGTPLERAVVHNRPDIAKLILENMTPNLLSQGLIIRRALLKAFRMLNSEVQDELLEYVERNPNVMNDILAPLYNTTWEYKGRKRSYLDAVTVGWVSGIRPGINLPLPFWRACCHGSNAQRQLRRSVENVLAMTMAESDMATFEETLLDNAINLAFEECLHDSIIPLLEIKAEITNGRASRLRSLRCLAWNPIPPPRHRGINIHKIRASAAEVFTKTLGKYTPTRFALPEQTIQTDHSGLLERPMTVINFIDQIFYSDIHGTLAYQAIWSGDRTMFDVLVGSFGADLSLPVPASPEVPVVQFVPDKQYNVYCLLAYTEHMDLWFANQFKENHVQLSCPLDVSPWTDELYLPPLFHALYRRFWSYGHWLLRNGASIDEATRNHETVLSMLIPPPYGGTDFLDFFFPLGQHNQARGSGYVPGTLTNWGGYPVFKMLYNQSSYARSNYFLRGFHSHYKDLENNPVLVERWKYFLEVFPMVKDAPKSRKLLLGHFSISRKSTSLFELARVLGGTELLDHTIKSLERQNDKRPFPRQSWLDWVSGQPLGHTGLWHIISTPLARRYGYWPSPFHPSPPLLALSGIEIYFLVMICIDFAHWQNTERHYWDRWTASWTHPFWFACKLIGLLILILHTSCLAGALLIL